MEKIQALRPCMAAALLLLLSFLAAGAMAASNQPAAGSESELLLNTFRVALVLVSTIFIIPLLLELAVAFVYIEVKGLESRILLFVIAANVVSFPAGFMTVIVLSYFIPSPAFVLLLAGALVIALETIVIYYFARDVMKFKQALLFSLLLNAISLTAELLAVTYATTFVANVL